MRFELKRLQRELGITTVYVTHDQGEALALSDTIGVMNEGQVVQVGTPRAIYERPASRFVADFVGTTNFVVGRVVAHDDVRPGHVRVDTEIGPLCAYAGDVLAPGDAVLLSIRPEDVELVAADRRGDNVRQGVIDQHVFLGEATDVHVKVGERVLLARAHPRVAAQVGGGDRARARSRQMRRPEGAARAERRRLTRRDDEETGWAASRTTAPRRGACSCAASRAVQPRPTSSRGCARSRGYPRRVARVQRRAADVQQALRRAARRHRADAAHPRRGIRAGRPLAEARPRQRGGVLHPRRRGLRDPRRRPLRLAGGRRGDRPQQLRPPALQRGSRAARPRARAEDQADVHLPQHAVPEAGRAAADDARAGRRRASCRAATSRREHA